METPAPKLQQRQQPAAPSATPRNCAPAIRAACSTSASWSPRSSRILQLHHHQGGVRGVAVDMSRVRLVALCRFHEILRHALFTGTFVHPAQDPAGHPPEVPCFLHWRRHISNPLTDERRLPSYGLAKLGEGSAPKELGPADTNEVPLESNANGRRRVAKSQPNRRHVSL